MPRIGQRRYIFRHAVSSRGCKRQTAERLLQSMACNEEEWPAAIRQSLNQELGITPLSSDADRLHRVISNHTAQPLVLAPDGYAYDKLFGDFQPSNNPLWRDGLL